MADTNRNSVNTLLTQMITEKGCEFDFFHAILLLHMLCPEKRLIGFDAAPGQEVLRFSPVASLEFAASTVSKIESTQHSHDIPFTVHTHFFSLYGRGGSLPWHYNEAIVRQLRLKKGDLKAFFDIFNHRYLSFFFRAGIKYRSALHYIPQLQSSAPHDYLLSFCGMNTRHTRHHLPFPDMFLIKYAGLFIQSRSASNLKGLLADFLKIPVQIRQFQPEWLSIDKTDQNTIGYHGTNNKLGKSFSIGRKILCRQHRFRIVLGPLPFDRYKEFLPKQELFHHLVHLTKIFVGSSFVFDVQLMIDSKYVPGLRLGSAESILGHCIWIRNRKHPAEPVQPVFTVLESTAA